MQTINNGFAHAWEWLIKWVGRPVARVATLNTKGAQK